MKEGSFTPPAQLEEYRIIRPLGQGAMGRVYLAHDTLLDRPVAIKFLAQSSSLTEGSSGAVLRERFFVEARAIARLAHPNVVAIYRIGEWRGCPYLVSELVRGQSLDHLKLPLPWPRVLEIGRGLGRGLAAAHRRRVFHRDIKPGNVMLGHDGNVKLLDFGLAKLFEPMGAATNTSLTAIPALRLSTEELRPVAVPSEKVELAATRRPERAAATPPPRPPRPPTVEIARPPEQTRLTLQTLTQAGDLLGSPLYMAPEQWQSDPPTQKADIYSLGAVLYELCAGRPPHEGATLEELRQAVFEQDAPPLATIAPTVDADFATIIDRCLRREPAARFESADALLAALEELTERERVAGVATDAPDKNPYRGLASFEARHRGQFFGREEETRTLLERLRSESFVVVTGDSGVGKSSLCQAGVIAAVQAGALEPRMICARFTPGRRPLFALANALYAALDRDETELLETLHSAPEELGRSLRRQNRKSAEPRHLLLFADQLEELFTASEPSSLEAFGRALRELCEYAPDIRLLASVRSDFLSRLAALPGLGKEVGRALFLLGPLSHEGLRDSIVRPALAHGFRFESVELVESLVQEASQAASSLPLLQFTLSSLWELRDTERRLIPQRALDAIGGLGGALARYADGVLDLMLPAQRQAARELFGLLVLTEGTRARRTQTELIGQKRGAAAQAAREALEALVQARILTVHADSATAEGEGTIDVSTRDKSDAESQYELTHEALLRSWNTLRSWLAGDIERRAARQRLEQAAAEWERLGRVRELLWQPVQLRALAALHAEGPGEHELPERVAAFLRASRRAARWQRFVRILLGASVPLLGAALFASAQLRESHKLRKRAAAELAVARHELIAARKVDAHAVELRQAALANFDARRQAEGERLFQRSLEVENEVRTAYLRASHAAEAGFMLRSSDRELRDTLATILSEQAHIAERNHALFTRDELLARVSLFDADGGYRRRFFAPARLRLRSQPAPATVELVPVDERYQAKDAERRILGTTPTEFFELPPGSYLLILTPLALGKSAGERLPVIYPVSFERKEELELSVFLPQKGAVPDGFVYIPTGRAPFGSNANQSERRDFLYTVPLHNLWTDGFLIAQNETTYADWLTYLRELPPEERSRRLPRAGQAGGSGSLNLRQLPDGIFELSFQPTQVGYRVREGELLHFASGKRPPIDWRKLPVTGISTEDANAYLAWLRASGRVKGARLCTEIEWERAARGADARHYPHGDELHPQDAAFDETYAKDPLAMGPDPVGSHPASRSVFGVDDMVGNAFEWVINSVSDKPYALRGGAYFYGLRTCRLDNRHESEPALHDPTVGLRVCAKIRDSN